MFESIKEFSISDVQLYREQGEDIDFSIVEIWALAEGSNSHRNPFSKEVLEEYAETFKGKFIVAKFDKFKQDCLGHELDEVIIGYVDPNSDIEFKTKDVDGIEKEFAVVKGLVSKIYATDIVDMFRVQNERAVSCEFSCSTKYEENEYGQPLNEYGQPLDIENPILKYHIHGITILGLSVNPSVRGTEIKVKQFAEKYNKKATLKELAEKRKESLVLKSHIIDKSKEAVDMGDWNGDKAKDDLLKESKYKTLAKSVCLLLENGWEDRKKTALKYPIMNLKDGKWVYNAEGLSSARAYAQQHDPSIASKVISIQKKLNLYKDNNDKEDTMEEEKKLSMSETDKEEKDVVMEEQKQEDQEVQKDKEMSENIEDKEMSEDVSEKDTDKEMSESEDVEDKEMSECADKEMSCDSKEMAEDDSKSEEKDEADKVEDKEEKKEFSLDAYADMSATLSMLENETEANKELANKVIKEMSASEIVETILTLSAENLELKKFKEERLGMDKDIKLASIMASVKDDLDQKQFAELQEEGKTVALDDLDGFANKVKAFAYEATKQSKVKVEDEEIMRFASANIIHNEQSNEDVFDRISRM